MTTPMTSPRPAPPAHDAPSGRPRTSSTVPASPAHHDLDGTTADAAPAGVVLLPGLAGHPEEFTAQVAHLTRTRQTLALPPRTDVDLSVDL